MFIFNIILIRLSNYNIKILTKTPVLEEQGFFI